MVAVHPLPFDIKKYDLTALALSYLDLAILSILITGFTAAEIPDSTAEPIFIILIMLSLVAALANGWFLYQNSRQPNPDQKRVGRILWISILMWMAGFFLCQFLYALFTTPWGI